MRGRPAGWRRWWDRRTDAERSLADLQTDRPVTLPTAPAPPVDPMAGFLLIPGLEHLATATDMSFGLQVRGVTLGPTGRAVLTSPSSEGNVEPGDLVGLVLIDAPHNVPGALDGEPERARAVAGEIRAALDHVRTTSATVVSFDPADPATPGSPATLVLAGIDGGSIPIGTLVMR